jgi:hypothetical protein
VSACSAKQISTELTCSALSLTPEDAFEAAKIAAALQHSFRKGVPVFFDEEGDPIMA